MDLYLGSPHKYVNRVSLGYALSQEMKDNTTIELYRSLRGLILDNGADELGEGQGGFRLAYLAGRLQPNWIILPDVLHEPEKTRKKSGKFLERMRESGYNGKYMAVIQDTKFEKALETYQHWYEMGVDRIGVPYDTRIECVSLYEYIAPKHMKRLTFLDQLIRTPFFRDNPMEIHLLGTYDVNEMFRLHHWDEWKELRPFITSHDTTVPFACDTKFELDYKSIRLGREKDWKGLDFNATFSKEREDIANWNVACYLVACKIPFGDWKYYPIKLETIPEYYEQLKVLL